MKRSEAENRRVGYFAIAMILHFARALDPVHELGHILATWAMGWRVERVAWSQIWPNYMNTFTLAAGVGFELLVWGTIALIATRDWSRTGFFASGASTAAWMTWWISNDRAMIVRHFASPVVWDLVYLLAAVCLVLTRRHQMWLKNPKTMRLVTGRHPSTLAGNASSVTAPHRSGGNYSARIGNRPSRGAAA